MVSKVYTVYVERRPNFDGEAEGLLFDLKHNLLISSLAAVRYVNRYFADFIGEEIFKKAVPTVFSEPQSDLASDSLIYNKNDRVLAVEYLPGQFDQRADSCEQCIQILAGGDRPKIRTAKIYIFSGDLSNDDFNKIKKYLINPVECREASLYIPETLEEIYQAPLKVEVIKGFTEMDEPDFLPFIKKYGLAMDEGDVAFCRDYFKNDEKRDPTMTELRLIDSYWSDHCRHTTFLTSIENIEINDKIIEEAYGEYLSCREAVYKDKAKNRPVTLMDMATIGAKYLKKTGALKDLDESEEINACSVKIKVETENGAEDWLLMFKNETHNHPTEIEPFGGAATCLGGAIRDPLSGRAYVYQAMRVTGAADPRVPVSQTLPGKLPQSKLTVTAANGYSSYGNQIGLATGGVYELYHPGYAAKRLEIGAVIGAAPASNVVRKTPEPGDIVILLGGRTGRDGCGGATGSSKAHTSDSLATCGAEVQKGNPPEERKIQRLFRNQKAARLIKRCNDFGAGGVSVAIGELADGLMIDLSAVPKKYEGLDGTELAISESQERMAVVVSASDAEKFTALASAENLEATPVAYVAAEPRLRMSWNGDIIVDLSRDFLNSNGAKKFASVIIDRAAEPDAGRLYAGLSGSLDFGDVKKAYLSLISDLNVCSRRGLVERFDSSIGASTVVMPYGGVYQATPAQYMAAKLPAGSETVTASVMAYGFNPYLTEKDPFAGAYCAVVESLARLTAAGVPYNKAYLTFQEYFERLRNAPERWGKPVSALLGALRAQTGLGVAAIGGKDSMSGSFEDMDVPPTLVSFAVAAHPAPALITAEFKKAGSAVYLLEAEINAETRLPDIASLRRIFGQAAKLAAEDKILASYAVGFGGAAEAVAKMCFGNGFGFIYETPADIKSLFCLKYGSIIIETDKDIRPEGASLLGFTSQKAEIKICGETIPLGELFSAWSGTLEEIFPTVPRSVKAATVPAFSCAERAVPAIKAGRFAKPRIIIPVFPGTNCEYDTARAFEKAGGAADTFVLRNLSAEALSESTEALADLIGRSQILALPGGFSGGDEPDGSAKFIIAVLRSPRIREEVTRLLDERGGLILGICNGFQALIKSGLLPYGKIMDRMTQSCPTLTFNAVKRHQSMMVTTRIASVKSPWLSLCEVGQLHTIPVSHGEGRFAASKDIIEKLAVEGRIATQYVDAEGNPTMDARYNPNSSDYAVEGILSPDGRIFGKMGHSERTGRYVAKNIPGDKEQRIFEAGINYFK